MSKIQDEIEARLADVEPDVEVLLAEVVGGGLVRLFIDHPDGVSLDLCEQHLDVGLARCESSLNLSLECAHFLLQMSNHRQISKKKRAAPTSGYYTGKRPAACY